MSNKNIIRVQKSKENPYVILNKAFLCNKSMSWKAKGLLAYLLSKPDDWIIIIENLIKQSPDGEKSVRSGLNELKENRYLQRYPVYMNGKVEYWESIVYEDPVESKDIIKSKIINKDGSATISYANAEDAQSDLLSQNLQVGLVEVEKVDVENAGLLNNEIIPINESTKNLDVVVEVASDEIENLIKLFNENIVELKPIQKNKFKEYVENNSKEYLEFIIEVCADSNIKTYKGFKTIINGYINKGLNTVDKVKKYLEEYQNESESLRKKERQKRKFKAEANPEPKKDAFTNYDQRYGNGKESVNDIAEKVRRAQMGIK